MSFCYCCSSHSSAAANPFLSRTRALYLFSVLISFASLLRTASALVHLHGDSFSFTFVDAPARFAVPVDGSGICGSLHLASPVDACSSLRYNNFTGLAGMGSRQASRVRFVLTVRGACSFETKVRNAQDAGFEAVIVFDDRDKGSLISMIGGSEGIWIHAVFVSKMAGETLKKFAQGEEGECCISPSVDETTGTVLIISLVSLVIIISVLATFFFARNCRRLRYATHSRPQSMNKQEVEGLPCVTFKMTSHNGKHIAETCAICLEDYKDGETLRILPCQHEFHSICVDSWLTKWGTFCPVCKHDMIPRK